MTQPLDRTKLEQLLKLEEELFHKTHPKSYELYQRARKSLHGGVPMLWMIRWAGSFPVFVKEAKGAHFTDVDGNSYLDLCLGDTGAMTGHSPEATVKAITEQIQKGITLMLPYEDVIWVGEELQRRFKLPYWQFTPHCHRRESFCLAHGTHDHRAPQSSRFQLLLSRHRGRNLHHARRRRHAHVTPQ